MKTAVAALALFATAAPARSETAIDIRHLLPPLLAALKVTPDCSPLDNVVMERQGVSRLKAPDGSEIYRVSCWANDQNGYQRYFTLANDVAMPLLFALYSEASGWFGTGEMPGSRFDEATGDLSVSAKPDSSGTCGVSGRWHWQNGAFHLIEMRYQPGCDGTADLAHWPIIFTAKEP